MTKALFFLIPLAFAVAMGLWLRHARQREGHRWITHWLATLAPLGLLAGLHTTGLINNAVAQVLMVPTVLGLAAFAGGALYLAGPTLLTGLLALFGSLTFRMGLSKIGDGGKDMLKGMSNAASEKGLLVNLDVSKTMHDATKSVGFPTSGDDRNWDWDNNKYY